MIQPETNDLSAYLAASEVIDFEDPMIQAISEELSAPAKTELDLAKAAYEFVRDQIPHSFDINGSQVTCQASEVLKQREGICFAKSHLLAALLRERGIPTGFCYQRLVLDDADPTDLTLHGLNAVYLSSLKRWIRVDARGNKPGVEAQFSLETEVLAYPVRTELGEIDYPTLYAQPLSTVITVLQKSKTMAQLKDQLPGSNQSFLRSRQLDCQQNLR